MKGIKTRDKVLFGSVYFDPPTVRHIIKEPVIALRFFDGSGDMWRVKGDILGEFTTSDSCLYPLPPLLTESQGR